MPNAIIHFTYFVSILAYARASSILYVSFVRFIMIALASQLKHHVAMLNIGMCLQQRRKKRETPHFILLRTDKYLKSQHPNYTIQSF